MQQNSKVFKLWKIIGQMLLNIGKNVFKFFILLSMVKSTFFKFVKFPVNNSIYALPIPLINNSFIL